MVGLYDEINHKQNNYDYLDDVDSILFPTVDEQHNHEKIWKQKHEILP